MANKNIPNDISIVVVTWNGDELLKKLLDSIIKVYGQLPETVVVDNANNPETKILVNSYQNTTLVSLLENQGFAGGNNAALPYCTKKYMVLLNNDTELIDDSISPLIEFLETHPNVSVAQGKVVIATSGRLNGCGGFFSPIGVLAFNGFDEDDLGQYDKAYRAFTIGGAFFAIRRDDISKIGGLFYNHFKSYYEEVDLCHRVNLAGKECWYVPTPKVLHWHGRTMVKFKRLSIMRQYYTNIWFSFLTCYGFFALIYFGFMLFSISIAHSLAGLLSGNAENLKAHLFALRRTCQNRKEIFKTRKYLKSLRKITDWQLLKFAVRKQKWSYYLSLIKRG